MNVGLVLSGGMAKGAYQIGALKALQNFVPMEQITHISAASVGVLNGYAYATRNLEGAETIWKHICNNDTRLIISQLLKSSMLQQTIHSLYSEDRPLKNNFYCSLYNFTQNTITYKNLLSADPSLVPIYLKASVAMPIYNKAVQIGKNAYFDGAMIDNIPVFPLLKQPLDYVICVYFDDVCYKFENASFDNKIIKITFPSERILSQSLIFRQDSIEEMITNGYDRTNFLLNSVFAKGYEDLDHIYHSIQMMNRGKVNKSIRVTGDVLVTNLNKVTRKIAKRKIL